MAKRFTDTEKYKDPWFRGLSPRLKALFYFMCDDCNHAGIWKENFDMFEFFFKIKITHEDMVEFGEKVRRINSDTYFITSFVKFQYGLLNDANKAHVGVLKSLNYNNIQTSPFLAPLKPLPSPCQGAQDKEQEQDMELDKEKEKKEFKTNSAPIAERKIEGCKDFSASYEMVRNLFNELVSGKGSVKPEHGFFMSPKIQDKFLEILGHEYFTKLENWKTYFETISTSDFLLGISDKPNAFKVSFLWVLDVDNAQPIMSGQYDNSGTKGELEYQRSIDELSKKYQE